MSSPVPRLTEDQQQEVLRRKAAGESVVSLCAAFGVKKSTIYRYTTPAGVTQNHGSEKGRRFAAEAARFPENQVQDWMQSVRRMLWRYNDHPEFEEMLGDAYLAMAVAMREVPVGREAGAGGLVMTAARHGAMAYLRSPRCRYRRINWEGNEVPWVENLEALLREGESEARPAYQPTEPDFAPRLIERLWVQSVWQQVAPRLTDLDLEVLGRTVLEAEPPAEVGSDYGLSQSRVYQIRQFALNQLRRQIGAPLRPDGSGDYQRNPGAYRP